MAWRDRRRLDRRYDDPEQALEDMRAEEWDQRPVLYRWRWTWSHDRGDVGKPEHIPTWGGFRCPEHTQRTDTGSGRYVPLTRVDLEYWPHAGELQVCTICRREQAQDA